MPENNRTFHKERRNISLKTPRHSKQNACTFVLKGKNNPVFLWKRPRERDPTSNIFPTIQTNIIHNKTYNRYLFITRNRKGFFNDRQKSTKPLSFRFFRPAFRRHGNNRFSRPGIIILTLLYRMLMSEFIMSQKQIQFPDPELIAKAAEPVRFQISMTIYLYEPLTCRKK